MDRRATVAALITVGIAAGLTPAVAGPGAPALKGPKGTWSFTDYTPDPTVSVMNSAKDLGPHCEGDLPPAPMDVNAHTLKVTGPGTLSVDGNNTLDWAMEILDRKGRQLDASDGGFPQDKEGLLVSLRKAGKYTVVFCNLGGAPTATAKYSLKYR